MDSLKSFMAHEIKTSVCLMYGQVQYKAMQKDFISRFSSYAKDETNFFSYSNLTWNKFVIFVFAKISRNKCGRKCETQIHKNDFENIQI